jgi:hypothetical protein
MFMVHESFDFTGYEYGQLSSKFRELVRNHKKDPDAFIKYDRLLQSGMPDFQNLWGTPPSLGYYVDWLVFKSIKTKFFDLNIKVNRFKVADAIVSVLTSLTGADLEDAISRNLIGRDMKCKQTYNSSQCTRFYFRHHIVGRLRVECKVCDEGVVIPLTKMGQNIVDNGLIGDVCKMPHNLEQSGYLNKKKHDDLFCDELLNMASKANYEEEDFKSCLNDLMFE